MGKKIFVIMPFSEDFFEMYETLKRKFGKDYIFSNAAEEDNQQSILKDIVYPMYESDVIIADLTGQNSNVMYELGIAHTLGKKTIIITKDSLDKLPFDLKMYRVKHYDMSYKMFDELIEYLERNLNGAIDGTVHFGNPVTDVLNDIGIKNIRYNESVNNIKIEDGEKGFVDFLADIEDHANNFSDVINEIVYDMGRMSEGITECTKEIERVNSVGGSGTASFVRKQSKKAAKFIDEFANNLNNHNAALETSWDEIENNTMGLIENQFSLKPENKESLTQYLKSLLSLKKEANDSLDSVEDLITKLDELLGLQRTVTQSVKFLKQDLNTFNSIIEKISKSVDSIMNKAKFVVGEIDDVEY